mmetsp:Transcript_11141/g.24584  ORF Transcript_11141/g.24584 Transcript_11141/m.24584 type:complete len:441 (+) Transcript_11141:235-1557(+)
MSAPAAVHGPEGPWPDPLYLLRETIVSKRKVALMNENLLIARPDGKRWTIPKSSLCAYRVPGEKRFIDIGSVYYMYKVVSSGEIYSKVRTQKRGYTYIDVLRRTELLDFLEGELETCAQVSDEVFKGKKRPLETRDGEADESILNERKVKGKGMSASKRPRVEAFEEVEDLDAKEKIHSSDFNSRTKPMMSLDVLVRNPGKEVPNVDFLLKLAAEEKKNWNSKTVTKAVQQDAFKKLPLYQELESKLEEDKSALPIILVPCNKSAPLNIMNIQDFLQDGTFRQLTPERKAMFEATRNTSVEVVRTINGKMWTFEVHDSTRHFTKSMWYRVVGVISDGTDWQFADWPFSSLVDLFTTCKGVYFAKPGIPVPYYMREWAVSTMDLPAGEADEDHRASVVRDQFWAEIAKWMMMYRYKRFSNSKKLTKVDTRAMAKHESMVSR